MDCPSLVCPVDRFTSFSSDPHCLFLSLCPARSYKAKRRDDGKVYGIKEIAIKGLNQADREEAVNEIRLLASVKNEHIIRYHEAFVDGPRLCIVMEFATHGDLSNYLKKRKVRGREGARNGWMD